MSAMPPPTCYVRHIGTAVPEFSLSKQDTLRLFTQTCKSPRTVRLLQSMVRLSGVERRHSVVLGRQREDGSGDSFYRSPGEQPLGPGMAARTQMFEEAAGPLVLQALRTFPPELLTGMKTLVTASCTHASAPGLENPIFQHTPLPRTVDRWNLGFMGCSAGLAGLRLIHQTATPETAALVVACELSSLHFQYTDKLDQLTANVLFADGAAAVAITGQPTPVGIIDARCAALPEGADQMVWFAADHGLQLRLSRELPDTLGAVLPAVLGKFLEDNGTSIAGINHWLVHPGGPQILDSVRDCLGLPKTALNLSRGVLRENGNMSSPTIFFIMKELLASSAAGNVVALAFGPGLTIEMALLRIAAAARP